MPNRNDEPTLASTSVSLPIARGRRNGERRATTPTWRPALSATRDIPKPSSPSGPEPRFVSVSRVTSLFERFARTVEPGSIGYIEAQRELRTALSTRMTEPDLWALMDRLTLRLPTPSARERFLLDVADLKV
jgi:hypothetical protein